MADDADSPLWRSLLTGAGRILAAVQVGFVAPGPPPRLVAAADPDPAWQAILLSLEFQGEPLSRPSPSGAPLQWQGIPVPGHGDSLLGVLWVARHPGQPSLGDSPAIEQALADLTRTIWAQTAWQDYRQALLRTAAHELRSPLTVIKGYLDLLNAPHLLPPDIHERANAAMREQAGRLEQVIREMALAIGLPLPKEATDPVPLADVVGPILQQAGITIAPPPPSVDRLVPEAGTCHLLQSLLRVLTVIGHPSGPIEARWEESGQEIVLRLSAVYPAAPLGEIHAVMAHDPPTTSACRHGWTLSLIAVQTAMAHQGGRLGVEVAGDRLIVRLIWPRTAVPANGLAA